MIPTFSIVNLGYGNINKNNFNKTAFLFKLSTPPNMYPSNFKVNVHRNLSFKPLNSYQLFNIKGTYSYLLPYKSSEFLKCPCQGLYHEIVQ